MSKTVALITGASSGMGREFAMQIDAHLRKTDEIWLTARRREALEQLRESMRNNVRIFPLDLTDQEEIQTLEEVLEEEKPRLRLLVNCAGCGKAGDFGEIPLEEQIGMIRLNCEALTRVTYCCLPYLVPGAMILQMASGAGFMPQPGFAVYAATKAYVNSFTLALREELRGRKIRVTSVCPGPVNTPFFEIAKRTGNVPAIKQYIMAPSACVVEKALRDGCRGRQKSVYGLPMQAFEALCRVIPQRLLVPLAGRLIR